MGFQWILLSLAFFLKAWYQNSSNLRHLLFVTYLGSLMQEGLEAASGPWGGLVGGGVASVGQPGGSQSLGPSSSTILLSVSRDRGSQPHHTSRQPADRRSRLRGKKEANWEAGEWMAGMEEGGRGWLLWWPELAGRTRSLDQVRSTWNVFTIMAKCCMRVIINNCWWW